jgi:hypothetical protein
VVRLREGLPLEVGERAGDASYGHRSEYHPDDQANGRQSDRHDNRKRLVGAGLLDRNRAILNAARLLLIELFRQGLTRWRSATVRSASAAAGIFSRAACANVAKRLRLAARLAPSVPFPSATAPIPSARLFSAYFQERSHGKATASAVAFSHHRSITAGHWFHAMLRST